MSEDSSTAMLEPPSAATAPSAGAAGKAHPPVARLDALTSIRFAAAAAVVFAHLHNLFGLPDDVAAPFLLGQSVSFFFVLSGFILTYVYASLAAPPPRERGLLTARFLLARFARLWPAHLTALVLCALIVPREVYHRPSTGATLANALMVHSWIPLRSVYYAYNSPSWSIATEFAFYLLFPLLIWRFPRRWPITLTVAALLTLGLIALCNHWHALGDDDLDKNPGSAFSIEGLLYVNPLCRLLEFVVGMCACRAFTALRGRYAVGPIAGAAVELAALALAIGSMYASRAVGSLAGDSPWIGDAGAQWLMYGGLPMLPFALLILALALGRGALSRLLSLKPLVLLGEISYSVYVLHFVLIYWCYNAMSFSASASAFSGFSPGALLAAFWIVLLLGSHLLWELVEKPARRWIVSLLPPDHPTDHQPTDHQPADRQPRAAGHAHLSATGEARAISWPLVSLESAVILAIVAPLVFVARFGQRLDRVGPRAADRIVAAALPGSQNARFGGAFTLLAADVVPGKGDDEDEAGALELLWRSDARQPLRFTVGVDLLDEAGDKFDGDSHLQESRGGIVEDGDIWRDRIPLSAATLARARTAGLYVFAPHDDRPNELLSVEAAASDWDGRRLLISLPQPPPIAATEPAEPAPPATQPASPVVDPTDTPESPERTAFAAATESLLKLDPPQPLEAGDADLDVQEARPGSLHLHDKGDGPSVLLPRIQPPGAKQLVVRVEMTVPQEVDAVLFWKNAAAEDYSDKNRAVCHVDIGRHVVYFAVPASGLVDRLRLDPGNARGDYDIHSIEIRPIDNPH